MKKIFSIIVLVLVLVFVAQVYAGKKKELPHPMAPAMTNDSIIKMLNTGLSSESIIRSIEQDTVRNIKVDLESIRSLKAAGADAPLITYLQQMFKKDNTYEGFYWWNADGKPVEITYSAFKRDKDGFKIGKFAWQTMTGRGVGYVAGQVGKAAAKKKYGAPPMLASEKDFEHLYIPGKTSNTIVSTYEPVFRLYLPAHDMENFANDTTEQNWYKSCMMDVQTPMEFQIVMLDQKGKKRYFDDDCKWEKGSFEGKKKTHKYVIDFEIEQFNNNTFVLTPVKPLKPGEYVIFWKNGIATPAFQYNVFGFDFTVPKLKKKKK